ncbi:hypothetical protein [Desulfuribacillus alkaliarsenatis]|uniref:Uncharacterized protein n=1 Tax=Desulfuribacillus alkaliarsenatis TaxID=766136 RepID=A0A1E5G4U0_9FIRM|nr:hypothetical protein [Desulfuribacillus alkaliarsenatis]OEF98202.1 hypothetical protein BHF68_00500 [Desulfuribacillus alkaliarsenatis]
MSNQFDYKGLGETQQYWYPPGHRRRRRRRVHRRITPGFGFGFFPGQGFFPGFFIGPGHSRRRRRGWDYGIYND